MTTNYMTAVTTAMISTRSRLHAFCCAFKDV